MIIKYFEIYFHILKFFLAKYEIKFVILHRISIEILHKSNAKLQNIIELAKLRYMNKNYKLTDRSRFSVVMKAAKEYGISISTSTTEVGNVAVSWHINGRYSNRCVPIDDVPAFVQQLIDDGACKPNIFDK